MDDLPIRVYQIHRDVEGDIPLETIRQDLNNWTDFPIGGMLVVQVTDDVSRPDFDPWLCSRWMFTKTADGLTVEEIQWLSFATRGEWEAHREASA